MRLVLFCCVLCCLLLLRLCLVCVLSVSQELRYDCEAELSGTGSSSRVEF